MGWLGHRESFSAASATHPGLVRGGNEDACLVDTSGGRFAIIDGMGGERGGALAAAMLRDRLADPGLSPGEAFQAANAEILRRQAAEPALGRMGCVGTAAEANAVTGESLEITHVGDTRAYLARADAIVRLTRDHTVAAERQAEEALTDEEALALPDQGLTRDLGRAPWESWGPQGPVEVSRVEWAPGDLLLLCTDGLSDALPRGDLSERLRVARRERPEIGRLAIALVSAALQRGGPDNVTVVIVRFEVARSRPIYQRF